MNHSEDTHVSVEIPALACDMEIDGIQVQLRCFWISHPRPRYEILVWARGQSGVVDVPADQESRLDQQMLEVAVCFATAVKIRNEFYS
jgi:hypothetical protein